MPLRIVIAWLTVCLVSAALAADEPLTREAQLALLDAVQPALVRVEYTLQYDKGEAPQVARQFGWSTYQMMSFDDADLVKQQRPLEVAGYLVGPRQVVAPDPRLQPRFIKDIAVRAGDQLIGARPVAYARTRNAVVLELDQIPSVARPLVFEPTAKGPYFAVSCVQSNATWLVALRPFTPEVARDELGSALSGAEQTGLIVTRAGMPVALTFEQRLPADDSWKGNPLEAPLIAADELDARQKTLMETIDRTLLHVSLKFRSPKKDQREDYRFSYRDDEDETTEKHTVGILLDPTTLLVLAPLKPDVTARLEKVQVKLPNGATVDAAFGHTLREFGGFTASLPQPRESAVQVADGDIRLLRDELLLGADIRVYGESREVRVFRLRLDAFTFGTHRRVYPAAGYGEAPPFLFTLDGRLVAAPLTERSPVDDDEYSWRGTEPRLTPVPYVTSALAELAQHADPSNVPLSEEEENRIAWLGVELQNLDRELARANNVSELTQDGQSGAIVSYVYPGSPAATAGIEPGFILLRLYAEDYPKPIAIRTDGERWGAFPWDRLGEVPEEYFDEIPSPWPPVTNSFTRTLTNLGFGRKLKAEFFHDGKLLEREFTIVESPAHFDSAKRFKSESLGLTVRDLTYEVRRYYQKADDEPGVIVSKIERGSKASVAGLKPYEIITHVDDQPVADVASFERLVADAGDELRLNVKRMTRGRIVKIKLDAPTTQP